MRKNNLFVWTMCIITLFLSTELYANRCLYTVSHRSGEVQMFEMDGTQLILRNETQVENHGFGAIDMAIDLDSATLFIGFEEDIYTLEAEGNIIELLNSRNLEPYTGVDPIILSGPTDITGLEYDSERETLFCTDRNTNFLWVFHWDAESFTLTPDPNNPIELDNIEYACGLARNGDTLYVSEYHYVLLGSGTPYQAVKSYDLSNNYNYLGAIAMGNDAIGIAYSPVDDAIYGGAFRNSDYLVKRVVDPNTIIQKDINAYINGVAADDETGLVYVTTQRGTIEVYDTIDWVNDPNEEAEPVFTYNACDAGMAGIEIGDIYKSALITLTKTDNLDPNDTVVPNDNITYTICYAPDPNDHENVVVIDYLPLSLTWVSAIPDTGEYDWVNRRYIWSIPHIEGGSEPNCLEITVQVNTQCNPNGQIVNRVEIESDTSYTVAYETTPVGCWGGNRIYVNVNAVGCNNGVNWSGAYTDLQDALTRAQIDCGYQNSYEIWVARGTYRPGNSTSATFEIPDNVSVYGSFVGTEDPNTFDLANRNFQANNTVLNGYAGFDPIFGDQYAQKVVTMGDETILDGFIVEEGNDGVYCNNNGYSFAISNCVIVDNTLYGIDCRNANFTLSWCSIKNNGYDGIYHYGSGKMANIENCKISDNDQNGIFAEYSTPTILNSIIHHNASDISYDGTTFHGIRFYQPSNNPVIRNNTIAYNSNEGILFTGTNEPEITNCILWGNDENGGGFQFNEGCFPSNSCYYDPNDPNGYSTPDGYGNIKCDPLVANPSHEEYDNYHLDPNSPCIEKGDDDFAGIEYEKDMDNDERVFGDTVDMGADEVNCEEVYNPLDWNADGLVNMPELAKFSAAWLSTDPNNDPNYAENWDPECDINDDLIVDIEDLASLADEWLWWACWWDEEEMMGMMMMAPGGGESMSLSTASFSASASSAKIAPVEEVVPMATLEEMTAWLEEIYGDNEEFQLGYSPQEWQEFIDEVKASWYESY